MAETLKQKAEAARPQDRRKGDQGRAQGRREGGRSDRLGQRKAHQAGNRVEEAAQKAEHKVDETFGTSSSGADGSTADYPRAHGRHRLVRQQVRPGRSCRRRPYQADQERQPRRQHHLIPMTWVDSVDDQVHLSKNCGEAAANGRPFRSPSSSTWARSEIGLRDFSLGPFFFDGTGQLSRGRYTHPVDTSVHFVEARIMSPLEQLFRMEVEFYRRLRADAGGTFDASSPHTSYALQYGYEGLIPAVGVVSVRKTSQPLQERLALRGDSRDVLKARDSVMRILGIDFHGRCV